MQRTRCSLLLCDELRSLGSRPTGWCGRRIGAAAPRPHLRSRPQGRRRRLPPARAAGRRSRHASSARIDPAAFASDGRFGVAAVADRRRSACPRPRSPGGSRPVTRAGSCAGWSRQGPRADEGPARSGRAAVRGTVVGAQRRRGPPPVRLERSLGRGRHPRARRPGSSAHVVGLRGDRADRTSPRCDHGRRSRARASRARDRRRPRRQDRRDAVRGILAEPLQKGRTTVAPTGRRTRGGIAAGERAPARGPSRGDGGRRPLGRRRPGQATSTPTAVSRRCSGTRACTTRPGRTSHRRTPTSPTSGSRGRSTPTSTTSCSPTGTRPCAGGRGIQSFGVLVAHTRPRRLLTERPAVTEELWGAYRRGVAAVTPYAPDVLAASNDARRQPGSVHAARERGVRAHRSSEQRVRCNPETHGAPALRGGRARRGSICQTPYRAASWPRQMLVLASTPTW